MNGCVWGGVIFACAEALYSVGLINPRAIYGACNVAVLSLLYSLGVNPRFQRDCGDVGTFVTIGGNTAYNAIIKAISSGVEQGMRARTEANWAVCLCAGIALVTLAYMIVAMNT